MFCYQFCIFCKCQKDVHPHTRIAKLCQERELYIFHTYAFWGGVASKVEEELHTHTHTGQRAKCQERESSLLQFVTS